MKFRFHAVLPFFTGLLSLSPLQAVVATYDGFDHYGSTTNLSDTDLNGFGWSGGWYQEDLSSSPSLVTTTTIPVPAPDNYLVLSPQSISPSTTNSAGSLARQFSANNQISLTSDRTVYASLLIRRNAARDQSFGLKSSISSLSTEIALTTQDEIRLTLRDTSGSESSLSGGSLPAGNGDFLIVLKLTAKSSGQESFSAIAYPSISGQVPYYEPSTWQVTATAELGTGTLDAAFFSPDARDSTPLSPQAALMGEFRLAEDWRDVIGAPRRVIYPADAGILDVTQSPYNASGDGSTDDTSAIQAAIHDALENSQNTGAERIVYFPEGTYLVSDTLWGRLPATPVSNGEPQFGLILQGESESGTTIRLADATFTNPSSPQSVVWFGADRTEEGNDAFDNYLRDLTIDTGTGNAGAIGVNFLGNNNAAIRRVTIRSQDLSGVIGLDLTRHEQGPELMSRVTVEGFDKGIEITSDRVQVTLEDITLRHQNTVGLRNESTTLAIRHFRSENTVPALEVTGKDSTISLRNGNLSGASGGSAIIARARLYLENVIASGYDRLLQLDGSLHPELQFETFSSDQFNTLVSPPRHIGLPALEHPEFFDANLDNWANVANFNADPNDIIDDSSAIQAAIDSGKSVIYFPPGTSSAAEYRIASPVILRGRVRQLEGLFQEWLGFSGGFAGESPRQTILTVEDSAFPLVFIQDLSLNLSSIHFHWSLRHDSPDGLVISNTKTNLINEANCGPLFASNVGVAPWMMRFPQKVWARQLNPETFRGINVLNNGGDLWVHGMKTERTTTAVLTTGGGRSEIHGAFHLGQWPGAVDVPIYWTQDAALSATFRSRGSGGNQFVTTAIEERSGILDTIANDTLNASALLSSYPDGSAEDSRPMIWIEATQPNAREHINSPTSGEWVLHRSGSTQDSLTVHVEAGGDEVSPTDFQGIPNSITFAAGSSSQAITLNPLDDSIREPSESVILKIIDDPAYRSGWSSHKAISIHDDDQTDPGIPSADLQVWLRNDFHKAADNRIYQWFDASGNDEHAYTYSLIGNTRAPDWNPFAFGERGSAETAVDYFQLNRSSGIAFTTYSERTLFLVLQTGSDVSTRQLVYQQGSSSSGFNLYLESGNLYLAAWPDGNLIEVHLPIQTFQNHLIEATLDTTNQTLELRRNGNSASAALPSTTSFAKVTETSTLGALFDTTRFPDGTSRGFGLHPLLGARFGEFLIYNRVLNETDKSTVRSYLSERLLEGYASWQVSQFANTPKGPASSDAASDADPDNDSVPNLIEYALGQSPLTANNTNLPYQSLTVNGSETYLTLKVPRSSIRSDLTYIVEVSTDLQTWLSGPAHTITLQDLPTLLEIRGTTTMESQPRQFLRLKVDR